MYYFLLPYKTTYSFGSILVTVVFKLNLYLNQIWNVRLTHFRLLTIVFFKIILRSSLMSNFIDALLRI